MKDMHTFMYIQSDLKNKILMQDFLKKYSTIDLLVQKNAEEGIALARKNIPEVIFIDTELPKMNGYSAAKILRKDDAFIKTRLIALCDKKDDAITEKCKKFGFNDSLQKPINHHDLSDIIDRIK